VGHRLERGLECFFKGTQKFFDRTKETAPEIELDTSGTKGSFRNRTSLRCERVQFSPARPSDGDRAKFCCY
jgi:hypothetical protein